MPTSFPVPADEPAAIAATIVEEQAEEAAPNTAEPIDLGEVFLGDDTADADESDVIDETGETRENATAGSGA